MIRKLWIILICTGLLTNIAKSQSDHNLYTWQFYDYLIQNNLQNEALVWLQSFPDSLKDNNLCNKINSEKLKLFIIQNDTKQAYSLIKNIKQFSDSLSVKMSLNIALIKEDTMLIRYFLEQYPACFNDPEKQYVQLSLKILKKENINNADIPLDNENNELIRIAHEYSEHKKKSALKAGLLSALIPGLGKYYLGHKYQAFSALTINIVLGSIATECLIKNPTFITWVQPFPLALLFYAGNIYGSVMETLKQEKDFQNNVNENIKAYYNHQLHFCN
jgi:hypothetical protein